MVRRALCFAIAALICTGCAENGGSLFATKPPPPPDPHTQMVALETCIFQLIQDERHKIDPNAKTLALDTELAGVARARSADMATKNYFAHKAPDGSTTASIIMAEDDKFQGLLGENIAAQHYLPAYGVDVEVFAHRFVDSWLASPAHKENLSFKDYDRTGVGAAVNGDTVYVTQLFASDLGLKPATTPQLRREVTELPHPKNDDAKPADSAVPPLRGTLAPTPSPKPSLGQ